VPIGEKMILDDVKKLLKELVILKNEETYDALTLWIGASYAVSEFDFSPRLGIWSPEKRCGKSLLLEIISYLVREGRMTSSISVSALFRTISKDESTVFLIDESDATFGRNADKEKAEALRQIINAGFKRGAVVTRCEGKSFEPKDFTVFCPVVLAGIGTSAIPETIADRSILIEMRRKFPNESIREFESDQVEALFSPLKEGLEDWIKKNAFYFRSSRPEMPEELHSRARDVWKSLFKIAESAGAEWQEKARKACLVLSVGKPEEEEVSYKLRLLKDVRDVFEGERMATKDLLFALKSLEEAPYGYDLRFNANSLSRSLRDYGIRPKQFGGGTVRGYFRSSFEDPWNRYLLPLEAVTPVTPVTPNEEVLW
jgi:hypothetical protein